MEEKQSSFTIIPMSQNISLTPGEVYHGSIAISNPSDTTSDFPYKVSVMPYGIVGDTYEADLITDSAYTMITNWVHIEEPTGVVKPNETKDIRFTIDVPEVAPAGGQYCTIAVSSNEELDHSENAAIQNVLELASVIYANVAGEISHDGSIIENNIPEFSMSSPITLGASLTNNGATHEVAAVIITATNVFTGQVILPNDESDGVYVETIMPETTRNVEHEVSNLPALGVVKITQTVRFSGQSSTVEKNVIICPLWFIILVVLVIVSIITTIALLIRRHRRKYSYAY